MMRSAIRIRKKIRPSSLSNVENQRRKLDQIGRKYGIKELDDWYTVFRPPIYRECSFILYNYSSLLDALKSIYPKHKWDKSKFVPPILPRGYWRDINNQKKELEKVGKELGVKELNDWYYVPRVQVYERLPFLRHLHRNLDYALRAIYPDHPWNSLRFRNAIQGIHKDIEVQRYKLKQLGEELGVKELDDWYTVHRRKVYPRVAFVTQLYGDFFTALKNIYPEHPWDKSKFSIPLHIRGQWNSVALQRQQMDTIGQQFGIKRLDDWYSVPRKRIYDKVPFLKQYYSCFVDAMKNIYPEHPWDETRFSRLPSGYWKRVGTSVVEHKLKEFVEKIGIQTREDLIRLNANQTRLLRGLAYWSNKPMSYILHTLFPTMNSFKHLGVGSSESKIQNMLEKFTHVIPQARILGYSVDLFLPEWSIAVEYQGYQHFQQFFRGDLHTQLNRDKRKQQDLEAVGISVIPISYWWNGNWSHLRSTLHKAKPALVLPEALPQ